MSKRILEASKFLSFVLRHQPEAIGIALDSQGWADIAQLIAAAGAHGKRYDRVLIDEIVATSDKKRYAISEDGLRIRAVQGHSSASVHIAHIAQAPPALLFHGTASRFVAAIQREGLTPGARHHVHLSADETTARQVGARHGVPVVLKVEAGRMWAQGCAFYLADNGVWLTSHVPSSFIER